MQQLRTRKLAVLSVLVLATSSLLTAAGGRAAAADADPGAAQGESSESQPQRQPWLETYAEVLRRARDEHKMALLWFYTPADPHWNQHFERYVIGDEDVQKSLTNFAAGKLTLDATIGNPQGGDADRVLASRAFGELAGQPGIVIIDMRDESSPHFHKVVSVYPFRSGPLDSYGMYALLNLPSGSLTQRTLVWAVMTHPERPMSAYGNWDGWLSHEAQSHSQHQASIGVQGHHQWGSRFQRITSRLPGGLAAQEVCAESWPGQGLIEAARECVHSWRQSSGHWDAVRRHHPLFGYDMKRGGNGIWYATGIFGRHN